MDKTHQPTPAQFRILKQTTKNVLLAAERRQQRRQLLDALGKPELVIRKQRQMRYRSHLTKTKKQNFKFTNGIQQICCFGMSKPYFPEVTQHHRILASEPILMLIQNLPERSNNLHTTITK